MHKLLTICFVVCSLFTVNLFAACNTSLDDSLGPSGNIYLPGDTIEYSVSLGLTSATDCNVTQIHVYFWPPNITPNNAVLCNASNGILIYDGGATILKYGDPTIVITSASPGAGSLAYDANEADVDANGLVTARICTKFISNTDIGPLNNQDTKSAINLILAPDFMVNKSCVEPNGTLIGEDVEFLITITNTGKVALDFNDTGTELDPCEPIHLEPNEVFQKIISKPSTGECGGDMMVPNSITVNAYWNDLLIDTKTAEVNCPVLCPPSFTVEKICLTDPITDELIAQFRIIITNTGYVPLTFDINDPAAGILTTVGPIAPDANYILDVNVPVDCNGGAVSNRVVVQAKFNGSPVLDPMPAEAECPCGREGCTPGFWKNHPDCWCDAFTTTQKLNTVFTFPANPAALKALGNYNLLQALKFPGGSTLAGKAQILLRAAVAALLNACSDDITYPLDVAEIVSAVNDAMAEAAVSNDKSFLTDLATELDMLNNLGCPINAHCEPNSPD